MDIFWCEIDIIENDASKNILFHMCTMQKLVLASPTSGGRSIGIVRSRTQATEFLYVYFDAVTFYWAVD
jgi:hypothetical protein